MAIDGVGQDRVLVAGVDALRRGVHAQHVGEVVAALPALGLERVGLRQGLGQLHVKVGAKNNVVLQQEEAVEARAAMPQEELHGVERAGALLRAVVRGQKVDGAAAHVEIAQEVVVVQRAGLVVVVVDDKVDVPRIAKGVADGGRGQQRGQQPQRVAAAGQLRHDGNVVALVVEGRGRPGARALLLLLRRRRRRFAGAGARCSGEHAEEEGEVGQRRGKGRGKGREKAHGRAGAWIERGRGDVWG